jgi:hypothetical protein
MTNATHRFAIVAFGILGIALVAGAVASVAWLHTGTRSSGVAGAAAVTSSGGNASCTQGQCTAVSPACRGSTEAYGNMTLSVSPCASYGFPSAFIRNATLDTPQVLAFIKTAYEYHLVYFAYSPTNRGVMYAVLNVTGYKLSYVGDRLLNVTVLQVIYSHFDVTHLSAYALPDRNASVAYTPQQAQAISVALSNPQVRSLMVGAPYYAKFVGSLGNVTATADYIVQLYQVDGAGIVGALVNPGLDSVVSSYAQQRGSGECWPDGIVITDPWGETGFSGCPG